MLAACGQFAELIETGQVKVDHAFTASDRCNHLWQIMIGLRADNNVDFGRSAANLAAFGLRNASGHGNDGAAAVLATQTADFGIDLLCGLFANMTGVEHDEIGIRLFIGGRHALAFEHFGHAFAIIDVHLAAVIFDRIGFGRIRAHSARLYIAQCAAATLHRCTYARTHFSGNRLAVGVVQGIKRLQKMQRCRNRFQIGQKPPEILGHFFIADPRDTRGMVPVA